MIDRDEQRCRLDDLVAGARAGGGGAVLVFGEPGIGKSALLADAVARAEGVRVLSVTGLASEAELPYATLALLLAPILPDRDMLSPTQAAALEGAFGLGPPARADRLATLMAVVSLLTAAATRTPLLVLVDDLQWLDDASTRALRFAAQQTRALPIALVLAGRQRVDWPGVPALELPGLTRDAALELLQGRVSDAVADQLVTATGGNPLALLEVPRQLTDGQRSGAVPLDEPLPAGATLERIYRERISELPAGTRGAVLLVAASESGAAAPITAALAARGDRADVLLTAEERGFVRLGPERLEFIHPLVRAAVYHGASAAARRAAHHDLAAAAGDPATAAWHRALAAAGPDEQVAGALERAGHDALARGAPAIAAAAYERAAGLSPSEQSRTQRLLAAADAAKLADRSTWALELLDRLGPLPASGLRADVLLVRAGALIMSGRVRYAYDLLIAEAASIEATDPLRAARLLCEAGGALMTFGRADAVGELAERARTLAHGAGPEFELISTVMLAHARLAQDDHAQARELLDAREAMLLAADPLGPFNGLLVLAALGFLQLADHERAQSLIRRIIDAARADGAFGALALALGARAALGVAGGRLDDAALDAAESVQLAEPAGLSVVVGFARVNEAAVAARRGDAETCRRAARAALDTALEPGVNPARAGAEQALGLLELGLGEAENAIEHLEAARAAGAGMISAGPGASEIDPLLVDAYVRAGRRDEARAALDRVRARAARTASAGAEAAAEHCAGQLAGEADFRQWFDAALRRYERLHAPFEHARTELCLGERLRRRRQPTEARRVLRLALRRFEAIGATVWAERARQELRLSGERAARAAGAGPVDALTPQERRVCEAVSQGNTNREVAAALYLSPRTVEHHLRLAYRKLGVRSRTELVAALVDGDLAPN
jgi:DNA-binding CsgD family transcriptional regulator